MPPRAAATAAVALLAALAPPAAGFSSLPAGDSPHEHATRDAADALGLPGGLRDSLADAVVAVDVGELRPGKEGGRATFKADRDYRAAHHCDRNPGAEDARAFAASAAYFQELLPQPKRLLAEGEAKEAAVALGKLLHLLQDCVAHSNVVDLGPAAADGLVAALRGNGTPPAGLRLTGFAPGSEREADPPNDPYPHEGYAKDDADGNAESLAALPNGTSKYAAAYGLAVRASADLLREQLGTLTPQERAGLFALQRNAPLLPVPVPPAAALAAALLAAAASRRR